MKRYRNSKLSYEQIRVEQKTIEFHTTITRQEPGTSVNVNSETVLALRWEQWAVLEPDSARLKRGYGYAYCVSLPENIYCVVRYL